MLVCFIDFGRISSRESHLQQTVVVVHHLLMVLKWMMRHGLQVWVLCLCIGLMVIDGGEKIECMQFVFE
ncbi:hypothetical protein IHE45_19G181600 [Dioscorea alata]|uniref:Uncharacterized protein n=1 Tax=Dioscorea alata TaxID=55571 RepID=A0ACB7U452_DIOAL|nr:hypothetical protein IHE45_19G181600 [Dioscorea alata]